jgi:hypothetical protein
VSAQPIDEGLAAEDQTRLRSAEQLVAAASHQIRTVQQCLAQCRLRTARRLVEQSAAEIRDQREIMGARKARQLRNARGRSESDGAEVALMHLEQHARVGSDRRTVVLEPRLVGGPNLDQAGAPLSNHIGHAEASADLHQLASRDDHLAAVAERREHQQDGCRAVVDGKRSFRGRELVERRLERLSPRPAPAGCQIELQIAVTRGDLRNRCNGLGRQRGAAQVRVQNDSGGVDRAAQAAPAAGGEPQSATGDHRGGVRRAKQRSHADLLAQLLERIA